MHYIAESQDVITAVLTTAYDFRRQNLKIYGLVDEKVEDGVLKDIDSYTGLPEPWTATKNICTSLGSFVSSSTQLLVDATERS